MNLSNVSTSSTDHADRFTTPVWPSWRGVSSNKKGLVRTEKGVIRTSLGVLKASSNHLERGHRMVLCTLQVASPQMTLASANLLVLSKLEDTSVSSRQ